MGQRQLAFVLEQAGCSSTMAGSGNGEQVEAEMEEKVLETHYSQKVFRHVVEVVREEQRVDRRLQGADCRSSRQDET